jgi:hypothetical protein
MARGRMLSKSLSTSQRFADLAKAGALCEFCQVLYPLIVSHADDFGRLQGDPFTVKHQCHPTSPRMIDQFAEALQWLHEVGLIVWYSVNYGSGGSGRKYIQIVNFEAHQQGLHKRTRSAFPRVPDSSGDFPEFPDQLKGTEENLTEGNLTEEKKKNGSSVASTEPAVLTFPTIGLNGASWILRQTQISEWQSAFPGIDILAEARKALAWLHANPGRRKTTRGMAAFLVKWFNRTTDSGRSRTASSSPTGLSKKTQDIMRSSQEFLNDRSR